MTDAILSLAAGDPAGGASTQDLFYAGIAGLVLVGIAAAVAVAHRTGRTTALARLGALSERTSGLPGWAALPAAVAGLSLVVAAFGFYWDVATHIDNGRDPGPFANPAHYLIIFGLLGIAAAGFVGILLGADRESPTAVKRTEHWYAPLGSVLLFIFGATAVLGFPLDDVWHRLFGQDVTLWGPTHIQMVGGASLSTLAVWILLVEGRRSQSDEASRKPSGTVGRLLAAPEAVVAGAFLAGLSTFQGEFDYSVPQFRLLFHPVLLGMAAGIALVAARVRLGPWGAFKALAAFLVLRGLLSLAIGPLMGNTTLHFPLYLGAALVVELVASRLSTDRQITFGAVAGAGIGVFGLATEWAWSHVWMTMSWPAELFPEVLIALPTSIAAGVLGGFIGRALVDPGRPRERAPRYAGALTGLVLVAGLVYPLPIASDLGGRAEVTIAEPKADSSAARFELRPAGLARDAEWFNVTSWQGGGSVVAELRPLGGGVYETERPVPITGEWKSLIRLHKGDAIVAAPIYMPKDEAIPAPEIPAEESFSREFVADKELLLREARETPAWLSAVANAAILAIIVGWLVAFRWGLGRMDATAQSRRTTRRPAPRAITA